MVWGGLRAESVRLAILPFQVAGAELPDTVFAELLYSEAIQRMMGSGAHLISALATDRYSEMQDPIGSLRDELAVDVVWVTQWERDGQSARARAELIDTGSMVSLASTTVGVPPDRLDHAVPRLAQWVADERGLALADTRYEPDPETRKLLLKAQAKFSPRSLCSSVSPAPKPDS